MARQNRWAAFGDAFNAVYDVGTTLARDYETLKIRNKKDSDYTDANGIGLTGSALETAKLNDYADIEAKYGDMQTALGIRQGAEDLAAARLNTQYQDATLEDRIRYKSLQNDQLIADTDLTNANAQAQVLKNDYTSRTQDSAVDLQNNQNQEATLLSQANQSIYAMDEYLDGRQAEVVRTSTIAQINADLARSPEFRLKMEADLTKAMNNARAAAADSETNLRLSENPAYQEDRLNQGLSEQASAAANAESARLTAERELFTNSFITEWSKTADPNDPTSMATLVAGLKRINPEMGMRLEQNYGEHELWQMTMNSLQMKTSANNALASGGIPGLEAHLENTQYGGDKDAVTVTTGEDGTVKMTAKGPNGTYTIAEGASEAEFMQNLQGYLDPATMLEIAKSQYDMNLQSAQADYYKAQSEAKAQGGALSLDEYAAQLIAQGNEMGWMLAFRSNPEMLGEVMDRARTIQDVQSLGGGDGVVPNPAAPEVSLDTPKNPEEEAKAFEVSTTGLSGMTLEEQSDYLAENKTLLTKYGLYDQTQTRVQVAQDLLSALDKKHLFEFVDSLDSTINSEPSNPRAADAHAKRVEAAKQAKQLLGDPEFLTIVLKDLQRVIDKGITAKGNAKTGAEKRLNKLKVNALRLQEEIKSLTQQPTTGLGGTQ